MLRSVDHMGPRDVVSAHPGLTNVLNNVPCFSIDEIVCRNDLTGNGHMQMLQPKQKSVALMKGFCKRS